MRAGCEDALDIDPCVSAGYRARRAAATKCEVLRVSKSRVYFVLARS